MFIKLLALAICMSLVALTGDAPGIASLRQTSASADVSRVNVHGDWTIEVRQADGGLVGTYAFHNDLFTPFAQGELTSNLTGAVTNGPWQVLLTGSPNPCNGNSCGMTEPNSGPAGFQGQNVETLTKTTISGGFRLRGSLTVSSDGTITTVHTYLSHCANSVAPNACHGDSGWARITQRVLPSAISILSGQQVLVTVDITFS
jgi:hypothetical protein